jgi:hypothetical protein
VPRRSGRTIVVLASDDDAGRSYAAERGFRGEVIIVTPGMDVDGLDIVDADIHAARPDPDAEWLTQDEVLAVLARAHP